MQLAGLTVWLLLVQTLNIPTYGQVVQQVFDRELTWDSAHLASFLLYQTDGVSLVECGSKVLNVNGTSFLYSVQSGSCEVFRAPVGGTPTSVDGWVYYSANQETNMCVAGPAQPDLNGVNLALNRPATQISDYTGASLSVDGNRNGYHNSLSCSHTGVEDNPWWMVDLGQDATISRVDIYYRMDSCCYMYIYNVTVLISRTEKEAEENIGCVCGIYGGPPTVLLVTPIVIQCQTPGEGRYVKVTQHDDVVLPLMICEVEVYT